MCGLAGNISENYKVQNFEKICYDNLNHRGPDDRGSYENKNIQLAHTRLSIIDLSEKGKQPMKIDNNRYVIVFNGEIYNYKAIKEELKLKGENFNSNSDTEILLRSYKIWGVDCLNKFEGMFSFLIWDNHEKIAFFARDRAGEKPFLYSIEDNNFLFASEYKALTAIMNKKQKINFSSINLFFNYNYTPEPFTLLENINKLRAGHYGFFYFDKKKIEIKKYWDVNQINKKINTFDKEKIYEELLDEIKNSIQLTLNSDVPIAISLSSGVDSSLIASIIKEKNDISAITVGYGSKNKNDELNDVKKFCLKNNIKFYGINIETQEFIDFLPNLVVKSDEPTADPALYLYYRINLEASKLGYKVLINGNGADEIFYGYDDFNNIITTNNLIKKFSLLNKFQNFFNTNFQYLIFRLIKSDRISTIIKNILLKLIIINAKRPKNQISFTNSNETIDAKRYSDLFSGKSMDNIDENQIFAPLNTSKEEQKDIKSCAQKVLFETWLTGNIFSISDRIGMSVSVENRTPFVNSSLISKLNSVKDIFKPSEYFSKKILKEVAKKNLDIEILNRNKQGNEPPVYKWIIAVVNKYKIVLKNGILENNKVIDFDKIEKYDYAKNEFGYYFHLYKLIILEFWYKNIFKT